MPKFAIMGCGGVGGYFGAKPARAGNDTIFIARGKHLEVMRRDGLRMEGPNESFNANAVATDDTGSIGRVDFILLAVKQRRSTRLSNARSQTAHDIVR